MNIKMKGFKKLTNYKLLYTLPLAGIGLIGTQQTANAMFNPPKNTPTVKHFNGASSASTSHGSLSTTTTTTTTPRLTTGVSPYKPSGARVSKLVSMFEPSSTTQPSSLETKQATTPDYSSLGARPKTPLTDTKTKSTHTSTLTINLGSKTSTSSITSTTQSESETSTTPSTSTSTEPTTTPNPWVDVNSFLNELKIGLQDINQNQESRNTKFKLSLEKSKLDIKKSLEKSSMAIAKEALSEQNTTFKKEIENTLQNQSKIAKKINSDLEKTKQAILDTARQSVVQGTLNVKQAMKDTMQSTIKGKSENNK